MFKWLGILFIKTVLYFSMVFLSFYYNQSGSYYPEGAIGYLYLFFVLFLLPDYIFTFLFPWVGVKYDFPLGLSEKDRR